MLRGPWRPAPIYIRSASASISATYSFVTVRRREHLNRARPLEVAGQREALVTSEHAQQVAEVREPHPDVAVGRSADRRSDQDLLSERSGIGDDLHHAPGSWLRGDVDLKAGLHPREREL